MPHALVYDELGDGVLDEPHRIICSRQLAAVLAEQGDKPLHRSLFARHRPLLKGNIGAPGLDSLYVGICCVANRCLPLLSALKEARNLVTVLLLALLGIQSPDVELDVGDLVVSHWAHQQDRCCLSLTVSSPRYRFHHTI